MALEGPRAYLDRMKRPNILGTIALLVALFAVLAGAGWYASRAFTSVEGPPMPTIGYLAMALGAVLSLAVGCGLMALLFYSARHGYDEPFQPHEDRDRDRPDD